MHTDIPTPADLERLLAVRDPACVSIYVPTAPEERGYIALLKRLNAEVFQPSLVACTVPFEGRKVHVHVDWTGDTIPPTP